MSNLSNTQLVNYINMTAGLIVMILAFFHVVVGQAVVAFVIFALITVGSSAYSFYKRFKKGDLTVGGFRLPAEK